jgi:hypothetical protein
LGPFKVTPVPLTVKYGPNSKLGKKQGATMNELISQIAQRTGLGEDKPGRQQKPPFLSSRQNFPPLEAIWTACSKVAECQRKQGE